MVVQRIQAQQLVSCPLADERLSAVLSALAERVAPGVYVPFRLFDRKVYYAVCYHRQDDGSLCFCYYHYGQTGKPMAFLHWRTVEVFCRKLNS